MQPHTIIAVCEEGVDLCVVCAHVAGPPHTELVGYNGCRRGGIAAPPVEVDAGVLLRDSGAHQIGRGKVGAKEALVGSSLVHIGCLDLGRVGTRAGDDVRAAVLAVLVPEAHLLGCRERGPRLVRKRRVEGPVRSRRSDEGSAGDEAVVQGVALVVKLIACSQHEGACDAGRAQREAPIIRDRGGARTHGTGLDVDAHNVIDACALSAAAIVTLVPARGRTGCAVHVSRAAVDSCPHLIHTSLAVLQGRHTGREIRLVPHNHVVALHHRRGPDLEKPVGTHDALDHLIARGRGRTAKEHARLSQVLPLERHTPRHLCHGGNLVVHDDVVVVVGDREGYGARRLQVREADPLRDDKRVVNPQLHSLPADPRRPLNWSEEGVLICATGLDKASPPYAEAPRGNRTGVGTIRGGRARPIHRRLLHRLSGLRHNGSGGPQIAGGCVKRIVVGGREPRLVKNLES
mmetsp:Transcript_8832/g.21862  ORF Transcript_8832/g.21862 Transcript_8832/m.21862 type:complete len:460 (-) Transcript_8832:13357-14736(-)